MVVAIRSRDQQRRWRVRHVIVRQSVCFKNCQAWPVNNPVSNPANRCKVSQGNTVDSSLVVTLSSNRQVDNPPIRNRDISNSLSNQAWGNSPHTVNLSSHSNPVSKDSRCPVAECLLERFVHLEFQVSGPVPRRADIDRPVGRLPQDLPRRCLQVSRLQGKCPRNSNRVKCQANRCQVSQLNLANRVSKPLVKRPHRNNRQLPSSPISSRRLLRLSNPARRHTNNLKRRPRSNRRLRHINSLKRPHLSNR